MSVKSSNFRIKVENKLRGEQRSIYVYNSATETDTIIDWPKKGEESRSEIFDIPYECHSGFGHFLLLTVSPRLGRNDEDQLSCNIDLPGSARTKFLQLEDRDIYLSSSHCRTTLNIEDGPPIWTLKVTPPENVEYPKDPESKDERYLAMGNGALGPDPDNITIRDNG